MGYIEVCILLSTLMTATHQLINYRLPNDSKPHHYKIKIIPHIIPGNFTFDGESEIDLEILNPTDNLILNSLNLEIRKENILLNGEDGKILKINQHLLKEDLQVLILNFNNYLQRGKYKLRLKYTGVLNNEHVGLFRDSYVDDSNKTIYLVGTRFGEMYARTVFPCWDEPALKATFEILIKHFPNYTTLSNMPVKKIIDDQKTDGKIWTDFQKTPLMSTNMVAFSVSVFSNITNSQGNFSVWSRQNVLESMSFVYDISLKALPLLEEYTNITYELPKMDIIAIPGYPVEGSEFWGIIAYNETNIMYNQTSFEIDKLNIGEFVIHMTAQQWIGNLVGPAFWTDIWIIEGIAGYLRFLLTSKLINFRNMMDFIVKIKFVVFDNEERESTNCKLSWDMNTSNEKCDRNAIQTKAPLIVHMLSSLISQKVFQTGIRNLLKKYKYKTITTDKFWEIMQKALNETGSHQNNFSIKKLMDPFIFQTGYPVINVFRNYTTGVIKLTQKCIGCQKYINNNTESKWWIPINFATNSSFNFSSTFATHWMNPEEKELIIKDIDPNDWIILNIQSTAYYRVEYDEKNWEKIIDYLNSENFSNIHVLNRVQLLEDAIWLYKQEKVDVYFLFNLSRYLVRETDYFPWVPGSTILDYLEKITIPAKLPQFKKYASWLTCDFVTDVELSEKYSNDVHDILKRNKAFKLVIRYRTSCLERR